MVPGGVPQWRSLSGLLPALGATELPNRITPVTAAEAAAAFAEGYRRVTGKRPSAKVLGLLIAQSAQETGEWKSLHNYNFENSKWSPADPYYQDFRCWEVENGQTVWYDPPDPHCRFAAHRSAADGAEHYVRVLARRPHWWAGLHTGTVPGFVAGLTTRPVFFTGDPAAYARRMTQFVDEYASLALKFAKANWMALVFATAGAFGAVFGGWYLYSHRRQR